MNIPRIPEVWRVATCKGEDCDHLVQILPGTQDDGDHYSTEHRFRAKCPVCGFHNAFPFKDTELKTLPPI